MKQADATSIIDWRSCGPLAATVVATLGLGFTQLGPHVHGVSTLDIAIDGATIAMELETPASDLLGFESAPVTVEQMAELARVQNILAQPLTLFGFPAKAACSTVNARSEQVFLGSDPTADAPAAPAGSIYGFAGSATYSNLDATYTIRCVNPEALATIDFSYFAEFPATQAVRVQVASRHGQFVFSVLRPQPHLNLAGVL